jgi:hypothetical protein
MKQALPVEQEILAEKATALARAAEKLEAALADLARMDDALAEATSRDRAALAQRQQGAAADCGRAAVVSDGPARGRRPAPSRGCAALLQRAAGRAKVKGEWRRRGKLVICILVV